MRIILWTMLGLVLLGLGLWAQAQSSDSPQAKAFDEKKLEEYRQQDAFRYDRKAPPRSLTWWQQFLRWLDEWLSATLDTPQKRTVWQWVLIGFSTLMVLYLILRLLKADVSAWLTGTAQKLDLEMAILGENIHEINFDQAIEEAIRQKLFRQAVRLYYLKTLKKLSDKKLIAWEKDKTNYDYVFELRQSPLLKPFQSLTQVFEYICYGDFKISNQEFAEAQSSFTFFYTELEKK
ncbi:MAG: DUF4129 domain-containing protein [Microscillaceae bacterium]|jgi:hypothetical protein|nr:DUF4129 domain-containing protein [Microscillaceae bacterium]